MRAEKGVKKEDANKIDIGVRHIDCDKLIISQAGKRVIFYHQLPHLATIIQVLFSPRLDRLQA